MERLTENMTCNDLKERWEWACGYLGKEHSGRGTLSTKALGCAWSTCGIARRQEWMEQSVSKGSMGGNEV